MYVRELKDMQGTVSDTMTYMGYAAIATGLAVLYMVFAPKGKKAAK
jgi:hypothetical protein